LKGESGMTWALRNKTAIAGVGKSPFMRDTGKSAIRQAAEALQAALDDCGLKHEDIDGLYVNGGGDFDKMAEQLGLRVRAANQLWMHGRMCQPTLETAMLSVAAGLTDYVACFYAIDMTDRGNGYGGGRSHGWEEFREGGGAHGEMAHYGLTHPGSGAAMAWRRYQHLYGATEEQLGHVAVATRAHACLNPEAMMYNKPMTMADYLASRLVIEPLRLFDCAQVNDGAVCIIVTSAERARDCRKPPVYIAGMQGLHGGRDEFVFGPPGLGIGQQPSRRAVREPAAYQMAGITRDDIDVFYCLDSFSPLVIFALEEFGFCGPGEAAAWVAQGNTRLGGRLPVNTHGGHLSEGMLGSWSHQVEAVRQLRNECGPRQVAGARYAQFAMGQGVSIIYTNQPD